VNATAVPVLTEQKLAHTASPQVRWNVGGIEGLSILLFGVLYWTALLTMVDNWWNDPESSRGLLLAPLAVYWAYRTGLTERKPQPALGAALLVGALGLRLIAEIIADRYVLLVSMVAAIVALIVAFVGFRQVARWWLPVLILLVILPLPYPLAAALAYPLRVWGAEIATWLLTAYDLPARLEGTIIQMPGRIVIVNEGCSGLRTLTTMLPLGLLAGSVWLRSGLSRAVVIGVILPAAVLFNGLRIFLTAFLVFLVDPSFGEGVAHAALGWMSFGADLALLAALIYALSRLEVLWKPRPVTA
jgi:exosortase